ncbi:helix-turn-helix transcriptional regulator [Streptomyces sp. NPDC017979]|uniref:helix-turn-helix transcriptional regulator n=1 Tax=Streptomyces sp. NPDC017979 TaxID=3365024 RepID=UPI003794C99F
MGLAERRKALGYSQEELAELLGVDRTTIGRWESGRSKPQPLQRRSLASALEADLQQLDALLPAPKAVGREEPTGYESGYRPSAGDNDEMIRREFLRILTVSGALTTMSVDEAEALADGVRKGVPADFARMNSHLWQVYQMARSKGSVHPVVRDQLRTLSEALEARRGNSRPLLDAAADLFQLAGEVAFDGSRYADAAASYSIAASLSKDAGHFDLWACSLARHAYVDMSDDRHRHAAQILALAAELAGRGDSALATRYWVASVQAEAYAGLGDLAACERALDRAEEVSGLSPDGVNGGWLRFDGTRLAEERGARYTRLGRLDLAEETLKGVLKHGALASGRSYRRRGAVLTDLAAIGAKRHNAEQVTAYGREALELARASSSGYVVRRLRSLCDEFGPVSRDHRVAGLRAEIAALRTP